MDTAEPHPLTPTTRIELVRLPPRHDDRWALHGEYVDLVWTEVLGVTAVAVARRLGHLLAMSPPTRGVSLDSLATPLRVPAGKVLDALRRIHFHGLVEFREHTAVIGASGLAPSIPVERVEALSAYTARVRVELETRADLPPPSVEPNPGPGSGGSGPLRRLAVEL